MPFLAQADGLDWRKGMISASGFGVPPANIRSVAQGRILACAAAKIDAQKSLLETVKGVRIDSKSLVKDAMLESEVTRSTVSGIVKGAWEKSRHSSSDGVCEVVMGLPMAGSLFSAVLSEDDYHRLVGGGQANAASISKQVHDFFKRLAEAGLLPTAQAADMPRLTLKDASQLEMAEELASIFKSEHNLLAAQLMQEAIQDYKDIQGFTGIIIDASDVLDFQLATLPWIRDAKGNKLYPNAETPYEVVRTFLPVSYDFSVKDALGNKRVATKPMVLKAVSTYKARSSDLVLDDAARERFADLMAKGFVNRHARIMIVVHE